MTQPSGPPPHPKRQASAHDEPGHYHAVQFYEDERYLCEEVARFLAKGFRDGHAIIVIATPEHLASFVSHLRVQGVDTRSAGEIGQFIQLDARETLDAFMEGESPNRERFFQKVGRVIESSRVGREHLSVLAYGEMVDILWREGKHEAAVRLEHLWNELASTHHFELLCAYAMNGFYKESHLPQFDEICRSHSRVIPTEQFVELDEAEKLREISLLQQRSLALETEIHHRKEGEQALLRELDDRRRREEELTRTEQIESFLNAVVESADDAIVSKTLEGIVTSWNPGAEKLFGYTAQEMIGRPISVLIPQDQADEEPRILQQLRRGERIDHYETKRLRKDGQIVDISLTVSPIKNPQGRVIGASKIARDITERKRIEVEREEMLEREKEARSQAEAVNRLKDEFLATLSHELRTPLNAILGWTNILESRKSQDLVRRAVEVIQRNAAMQKRLIEDLLDMARILSGKMIIKREMVDLIGVLNAAVDSVSPAAQAKGIRVEIQADQGVRFITGDSDRLQQVIWNLLSNSIKFTPRHGRVQATLRQTESHAEITVQDSGQGIPPGFLPHVFERFRQADGSTSRQHGGLGLGLAVVRHLAEAHGGRVWANSEGEGKGSTFVVSLPVANMDEGQETANDQPSLLRGRRVLVVEDEPDASELFKYFLEEEAALVRTSSSVDDALELLDQQPFDVLISDIGLPQRDGYDLITAVRNHVRLDLRAICAIAATSYASDDLRRRMISSGFDDYFVKPIDAARLVATVLRQLRKRNRMQSSAA